MHKYLSVSTFTMLSSLFPMALLASVATALPAANVNKRAPPAGFVSANGNKFQLDGKDFYFAGSNAYYFPFTQVCQHYNTKVWVM